MQNQVELSALALNSLNQERQCAERERENESIFRRISTLFCSGCAEHTLIIFTLYFPHQELQASTCTASKKLCALAPPAQAAPKWQCRSRQQALKQSLPRAQARGRVLKFYLPTIPRGGDCIMVPPAPIEA